MPDARKIAKHLGKLNYPPGDGFSRVAMNRLRERIENYDKKPVKGDIRLKVPNEQYLVVALRNMATSLSWDDAPIVSILEPADNSEVSVHVAVRGRIEGLDPDLRVWMVVLAPDGWYYLQSRVSLRSPTFECHTRTGAPSESEGLP